MNNFEEVVKEVKEVIKKSPVNSDLRHAELTLEWVLKLKPDADEALQIAAISHDIDRGATGITGKDIKGAMGYSEYKKQHAIRSDEFICEILERREYPKGVVNKVKNLVEAHEVGGEYESDILKDADSIAYFEYNIPEYLKRNGEEWTKEKIKFMYKRMSPEAKRIVTMIKYGDEAIEELVRNIINQLNPE